MVPFVVRLPRVRLVVALLVAGLVTGHMVVTVAVHSSMDLFNLNEEGTLGTWFSAAFLASVALGCLVLTHADEPAHGTGWRITAAVFGLASLDEVAQLHDRVGKLVGNGKGPFYFGWVIPGAVAAVAMLVALLRFGRRLARPLAVRLAAGSFLFLFGAVGMEAVGGHQLAGGVTDDSSFVAVESSRRYLFVSGVEEAFELVGEGLLVVTVATELARRLSPSTPGTLVIGPSEMFSSEPARRPSR